MQYNAQQYTFTYPDTGKNESVELEDWGWIAIYNDGSYLKQFDEETGVFHQFKEIDQDKLDVFAMQSLVEPNNPHRRFEVQIEKGMKPVHFYNRVTYHFGTPDACNVTFYCFGYEENINGKTVKTILKIHPNGATSIHNH